jgi:hypothetical protein
MDSMFRPGATQEQNEAVAKNLDNMVSQGITASLSNYKPEQKELIINSHGLRGYIDPSSGGLKAGVTLATAPQFKDLFKNVSPENSGGLRLNRQLMIQRYLANPNERTPIYGDAADLAQGQARAQ